MKYIHGGTLQKKAPGSAIVRVVFGSIILLFTMVLLLGVTASSGDPISVILFSFVFLLPASFLLLFFGIRALSSSRVIPRHDASVMLSADVSDPYFTIKCERCGLVFDYQYSDLGFRPWYPSGYVECPRCEQPTRHNASINTFSVEERIN